MRTSKFNFEFLALPLKLALAPLLTFIHKPFLPYESAFHRVATDQTKPRDRSLRDESFPTFFIHGLKPVATREQSLRDAMEFNSCETFSRCRAPSPDERSERNLVYERSEIEHSLRVTLPNVASNLMEVHQKIAPKILQDCGIAGE